MFKENHELEIEDQPLKRQERGVNQFQGHPANPIPIIEEEKMMQMPVPRSSNGAKTGYRPSCTHDKSVCDPYKCPNSCLCSLCFFKSYLLTGRSTCPQCAQRSPVQFASEVKCSSCLRHFQPDQVYQDREFLAVCAKGCVLCTYCIKVDEKVLKCAVCETPVETLGTKFEIERKQSSLHYACFCELEEHGLEKLPCKHRIHDFCKNIIYDCRICGFHVNPRPVTYTISSFML